MKTIIKIGYDTFAADLTGGELEQLTKIASKLLKINHQTTMGDRQVLIVPDQPVVLDMDIRLVDTPRISQTEYDRQMAIINRVDRAAVIARYQTGETNESQFITDIRYHDAGFNYTEAKEAKVSDCGTAGVLVTLGDGAVITFSKDGTYTRS